MKWKGLRDTYRRELKKQRSNANSSVVSENIRDPSWTHYSSMNFLREYMGNNNNHGDIFQFHGWSAEETPSADEASAANDDGAFVAVASIVDLIGVNASPDAASPPSSDCASEDEAAKIAVKVEPRSTEMSDGEKSPVSPADANNKDVSSATGATNSCGKKSKSGEGKRSSGSLSRFSRIKEHRRMRSRISKNHIAAGHHHHVPNVTISNHDVDMDDTDAHHSAAGPWAGTNADESDDDLYFFKSLIPFVKNLPPTRKLYLRAEIHNLVLRELMSDGSSNGVIPLEHVAVGLNA